MDEETLRAYDTAAARYAREWRNQPEPSDLHQLIWAHFALGLLTADIGCGAGRDVAWLNANGYPAVGYDASPGLLLEANKRYPRTRFEQTALPDLAGIEPDAFDNVLCETVIMHLPPEQIAAATRRLLDIVKPGGVLYLSWRVTEGESARDTAGRLYAAFEPAIVRGALDRATVLHDRAARSASSGALIHRIIVRKARGRGRRATR